MRQTKLIKDALKQADPKQEELYLSIIDAIGRKMEDAEFLGRCGLIIKKPVAWALYQVWREFDRKGL